MPCPGVCAYSPGSRMQRILLAALLAGLRQDVRKWLKSLEARVGFEPTNGGFADLSLGPLGYRAESLSIANQPGLFGHALLASLPAVPIFSRRERGSSLRAKIVPILRGASD